MASDDLTQNLPDEDKDRTTQPTTTALLERIQKSEERMVALLESVAARLETQIAALREEFRNDIAALRHEMNQNFRRIENKIQVLNEDTLDMRASQREVLKQMRDLESKAS